MSRSKSCHIDEEVPQRQFVRTERKHSTVFTESLPSQTHTTESTAYKHTHTQKHKKDVNEELFLIFDILYFDFRTPNPIRYFKILYFVH